MLARARSGAYRYPALIATEWIVDRAVLPNVVQVSTRIAASSGRIVAVDQQAPSPTARRLRGVLLPGFVDLQCNGAGGRSVDEGTDDALDTIAEAVWRGGAVAFLPTLISAPWARLLEQMEAVAGWIDRWDARRPDQAEPLGIHLEGPFLTAPGAHDPAHFVDPEPSRIKELLDAARGRLRLVTIANARPGAADAIAAFTEASVTCALGHCDSADGFAECVLAGAVAVTHLFNVMGPLHHRNVGPAVLALDDERVSCPLICDGVHVHPSMLRSAFKVLGPDRTVLVTDSVAAAGMPDGQYHLSGLRVAAENGVVRDEHGRLAGSALTMGLAAQNFLRFVPTTGAWTLARLASTNPARLARASDRGSIAVGQRAAFTLLGDDGSVTSVGS